MTKTKDLIQSTKVDPWGRPTADGDEYAALCKLLNEEARENWDNEAWHREVAADIASSLDYAFTFENLFSSYFQVQDVGEFDRVILREKRGLSVFYTSRGGEIEESQLRTEEWELPRDTLGFHVSEHEDKLRANFAETAESLVNLGTARLDAEVNRRAFSLMQEAIPVGSPYYVSAAGISKATVDQAIREVRDAIKPNGVFNVPITIAGRAAVIDKITDFDLGFDPEATAEIRRRGRLGIYRGANVQQIVNYTDENDLSYIPANELWIFGGTVGRFARYGGMQTKNFRENTAWYWHYLGRKDVGGLIHHPEQARRIVDTTVTP